MFYMFRLERCVSCFLQTYSYTQCFLLTDFKWLPTLCEVFEEHFLEITMSTCCVYRVPPIFLPSTKWAGVFWVRVFSFGKAQSTVVLDHFLGDMESVGSCKVETHHLILKVLLNNTQFQECRIVPNVKAVLAQFPKQVIFTKLCFYWACAMNSLIKLG